MVLQVAPKTSLDLLCEVALSCVNQNPVELQALDNDKTEATRPRSHVLNLSEILKLNGKQLTKYFTRFEANELRRLFKYTCCLMPAVCHFQTRSFGSEAKALAGIREHLQEHLRTLASETNDRVQFTAETVVPLSRRTADQKPARTRPVVTPDPSSSAAQQGSSQPPPPPPPPPNRSRRPDTLRDHDYARDGPAPHAISAGSDLSSAPADSDAGVAGERAVMRSGELPIIIQDGAATVAGLRRYTRVVERDEFKQRKKPKGLAKFISQSEDDKAKARQALSEMRQKPSLCNNYVCRICYPPQRFTALSSLQSHYKSHLGLREFTCQLCQKSFTRKMSLDYHMLIHAHKTRFRCDSCGHEFRHKSHYTEHLRRHTGETPYLCSECGLGFKAKNSYRRHLESKHRQRLTHTGNIVILSEDEHRHLMEKSSHEERSRKGRLAPGERPPPSPSRTGVSFVDVVVRDATGQVEYMCNTEPAAELVPPPLLKPADSHPASDGVPEEERRQTVGQQPKQSSAQPMDMLQQVMSATMGPEHVQLDVQLLPPPRVNLTSRLASYDVRYCSSGLTDTLVVK